MAVEAAVCAAFMAFLSIRDKMPLDECDMGDYNAKHKDELKMSRIEFE